MKTKFKKLLSLILAITTIISMNVATNISVQAATTIKNYSSSFDWLNDEDSTSFTISSKKKVKFTFNSEIKATVSIYSYDDDYYYKIYIVDSNYVESFTKTVTLTKGTYYVDFVSTYIDWDDDNDYNFSLEIQDVTVASTGIKFNTNKKTCSVGKTFTLNPTLSPAGSIAKSIAYSSSNSKVATVNKSGVVTAKGLGKCTITAKLNNGKKATYTVTVNSRKLYVFKGLSRTSPTINGKTNSNWKVGKKSVASYKKQKFNGLSTGATTFTTKVNKVEYKTYFYIVDYNTMYKKGVSLIKDDLKDPNSFTVYHIYQGYDKDGNPTIVLDSGAKNSYGGMVRDYSNIWVEYNASKKKFVYNYYNTDNKISLTGEKKIK